MKPELLVPEIRWVGELQRVDVKPGDRFVLSIAGPLSPQMREHLEVAWKQFIGGDVPIMVLEHGTKLGVFGAADADQGSLL